MVTLDPNRKIKKYAAFGVIAFVWVVLILLVVFIKNRPNVPTDQSKTKTENTIAEKQKAMLDVIQKANENAPAVSAEELDKKQQDVLDAIDEANKNAPPVSDEERTQRQKDMLDAINAQNAK